MNHVELENVIHMIQWEMKSALSALKHSINNLQVLRCLLLAEQFSHLPVLMISHILVHRAGWLGM